MTLRSQLWIGLIWLGLVFRPDPTGPAWAQLNSRPMNRNSPVANELDGWRRTAQGWQQPEDWLVESGSGRNVPAITRVHPLILASLQILVSVSALLAAGHRSRADD